MIIRQATQADIPMLVTLRMALFCEVGELSEPLADLDLWQATSRYFGTAQAEESARSWVAEVDGEVVASATLALFVRPPYPGNLAGREGYLLNMYTLPAHRRQGLAGALLGQMADYARVQQLGRVWLHASDEGRPLYERIGFVANPAYLEWQPG
ncbi:GNAT family N-acetyltransferase [Aeromonas hydrophila]|uniref:GNAT family N-acetyltransferase n=1 Tax=Aeromonas hydrophila TaxID=644 RepID=UPI00207C9F41|nr:GNAT family N-acetyltransferase [Aeromonas hydrophila]MCO4210839.1 GNAT family N-acetyltransferase [Aeromonas hydrophila]HDX8441688.1 GNAT family N-acetyltransferase [Aeromonas hydrophila]HDX8635629.1 GNAT family N-acetyltransferase [Aeromonas hydrophila]